MTGQQELLLLGLGQRAGPLDLVDAQPQERLEAGRRPSLSGADPLPKTQWSKFDSWSSKTFLDDLPALLAARRGPGRRRRTGRRRGPAARASARIARPAGGEGSDAAVHFFASSAKRGLHVLVLLVGRGRDQPLLSEVEVSDRREVDLLGASPDLPLLLGQDREDALVGDDREVGVVDDQGLERREVRSSQCDGATRRASRAARRSRIRSLSRFATRLSTTTSLWSSVLPSSSCR